MDEFARAISKAAGHPEEEIRKAMLDAAIAKLAAVLHTGPQAAPPAPSPAAQTRTRKPKQPRATKTIDEHQAIPVGEVLELRLQQAAEHAALGSWLRADSCRARAVWVGGKGRVLEWEYDGRRYTPTGLFKEIWRRATGTESQSVRGPLYWWVPARGSLAAIARALLESSRQAP